MINPYAIYVFCDGAMDYGSRNPGGVGFVIKFPESVAIDDIPISIGQYAGGNIERLELEALIRAIREVSKVIDRYSDSLRNINQIIFITDRIGLCDSDKTNPFKINEWRRNKWKNHEGKPIKNHKLLDSLDKERKKLSNIARSRINIEYRPRKQNRNADKLAKAGKKEVIIDDSLSKKGEKIGRRKYDGAEINYKQLKKNDQLQVHVFRKDPVQDEWEVWCDVTDGIRKGCKLKLYADNPLSTKLKRGNEFQIKVKTVYSQHFRIYRTIKKLIK